MGDETFSKEQCLKNVMTKTGKGSIIVFHDSEKAFARLQFVLPLFLSDFAQKGYAFKRL